MRFLPRPFPLALRQPSLRSIPHQRTRYTHVLATPARWLAHAHHPTPSSPRRQVSDLGFQRVERESPYPPYAPGSGSTVHTRDREPTRELYDVDAGPLLPRVLSVSARRVHTDAQARSVVEYARPVLGARGGYRASRVHLTRTLDEDRVRTGDPVLPVLSVTHNPAHTYANGQVYRQGRTGTFPL